MRVYTPQHKLRSRIPMINYVATYVQYNLHTYYSLRGSNKNLAGGRR